MLPVHSILEELSVRPKTAEQYREAVLRFRIFTARKGMGVATAKQVDAVLVAYMNDMFMSGVQAWA